MFKKQVYFINNSAVFKTWTGDREEQSRMCALEMNDLRGACGVIDDRARLLEVCI